MPLSHRETEELWNRVKEKYERGYCVSERGLHAELFCEISRVLPDSAHVIVEPTWTVADNMKTPDLVIVKNERITDIFELKFVPHHYAHWKLYLRKLLGYGANPDECYDVRIVPRTGKWKPAIPIDPTCRRHFVAVSKYDAGAVWSELLRKEVQHLAERLHEITHYWYGRVRGNTEEDQQWGIKWSI